MATIGPDHDPVADAALGEMNFRNAELRADNAALRKRIAEVETANAELRMKVGDAGMGLVQENLALRKLLGRADSMLSLLRHRGIRPHVWGTLGMPREYEVDQLIGLIRRVVALEFVPTVEDIP